MFGSYKKKCHVCTVTWCWESPRGGAPQMHYGGECKSIASNLTRTWLKRQKSSIVLELKTMGGHTHFLKKTPGNHQGVGICQVGKMLRFGIP